MSEKFPSHVLRSRTRGDASNPDRTGSQNSLRVTQLKPVPQGPPVSRNEVSPRVLKNTDSSHRGEETDSRVKAAKEYTIVDGNILNKIDNLSDISSELSPMPENENNDDGVQRDLFRDLFLYTKLSKEQEATVRAAENQLTATQLEQIRKRDMIIQQQQLKSPGTGTLSYVAKGKFTDHNEEISDDELNTEKQKAALNKWNVIRNEQSKSEGESQIEHTSDQESH
ncbi:hypothetical protein F5876DRAFT_78443 [Lentinula aff. lateritia]|uniref:Uncharacterized protein n=1 Tax=Lentinula aff. lateritia TaxID=2804960 RepID=A0ACC1TW71_9AGAR|nr:hypothetical protein F5876DRAFT_78443 [Lentinula aff. lateritia]